ncbi:hypothetical protein chiPu_0014732 [Chiloscyllium punctatum]|uniref:Uncharacterized protein n=1 Tax=Chiloscyllium punctatum TaxID=137246 RepID=A0A401T0R4_CHIPU|nr:hypothetical protein [Chiloscyllium punctatum]
MGIRSHCQGDRQRWLATDKRPDGASSQLTHGSRIQDRCYSLFHPELNANDRERGPVLIGFREILEPTTGQRQYCIRGTTKREWVDTAWFETSVNTVSETGSVEHN